MTPETKRESDQLRATIWNMLQGHNPAACADALITLLAHVVARNAHDHATMAATLARNLALAVGDDDDDAEPVPHQRQS